MEKMIGSGVRLPIYEQGYYTTGKVVGQCESMTSEKSKKTVDLLLAFNFTVIGCIFKKLPD